MCAFTQHVLKELDPAQGQFFKQSKTALNSEFFFWNGSHTKPVLFLTHL